MLDKVVDSCNFLINNYHEASGCLDYLNSRISKESQDAFKFGYFPDIANIKVITSLVDEKILKDTRLYYSKMIEDSLFPRVLNFLYFENHPLIFPIRNVYGEIVALVGRSILSEKERKEKNIVKYKNTIFKKNQHIFGIFENKKSILEKDLVYIVEGQMDLIKAYEIGLTNVIALGTSNMSTYQFGLISRYTSNMILLLDNDDAGQKGRNSIITKFGDLANIQNFYIPEEYKDIDEYISSEKITSSEKLSFQVKL